MRLLAAAIATLSLMGSAAAQTQELKMKEDAHMVAPALEKYRQGRFSATSGSARACRHATAASPRSPP